MSDYGMRVAKPGYDAITDADYNMAFTSKLYSDKVLSFVVISATLSGSSATATVAHNLGYAPQFWAFDYTSGSVTMPEFLTNYNSTGVSVTMDANADANNINICWLTVTGTMSPAVNVRAVIFIYERRV